MDCRPPAAQRTRRVIAAGKGSPDSGSKPQQVHQRRRHARGVQGAANRCGHGVLMVWHRNRPDKARHYGAAFKRICKRLLAGNPMCANLDIPNNLKGAKGLCEQQCSVDCPADWLGRYGCDDNDYTYLWTKNINPNVKPKPNSGCNTAACEYDKGDCPQ